MSQEHSSNPDIGFESFEETAEEKSSESKDPETESAVSKPDDNDKEPDETLSERLWGLAEMFPEPVRKTASTAVLAMKLGLCKALTASRTGTWIVFSSSVVLFAPLLLEVERANMQELQKNQQKELLLGPSGAISGGVQPMLVPALS